MSEEDNVTGMVVAVGGDVWVSSKAVEEVGEGLCSVFGAMSLHGCKSDKSDKHHWVDCMGAVQEGFNNALEV